MVRDVGLAEDLASDALVAALETWPESGVPDNPGAWLMTTAKHKAIDPMRRNARLEHKTELLAREARVALTLRIVGGLKTEEIARAFLVPSPTIGQRISRAKRTLSAANVPFAVPEGSELDARLPDVLEVVYLIFNEGYAATAGDAWMRPALVEDALRLGRVLAELAPREPEVHGLVALMEIQASRLGARMGPSGEPVLLLD